MNTTFQKKLLLGTASLALLFGYAPQTVFADASVMVQTTGAQSVTYTTLNSSTVAGPVMKATLTTPAKSVDQLTFKEFMKDMTPKSTVPSKILEQAEKAFKQYQTELAAKQDQKAIKTFEKLIKLLAPYQELKVLTIKATSITGQK